jgi:hypothetical protein
MSFEFIKLLAFIIVFCLGSWHSALYFVAFTTANFDGNIPPVCSSRRFACNIEKIELSVCCVDRLKWWKWASLWWLRSIMCIKLAWCHRRSTQCASSASWRYASWTRHTRKSYVVSASAKYNGPLSLCIAHSQAVSLCRSVNSRESWRQGGRILLIRSQRHLSPRTSVRWWNEEKCKCLWKRVSSYFTIGTRDCLRTCRKLP